MFNYKNYIFDLDDTLVQRDTCFALPNRIEMLSNFAREGITLYIATNQSPPAWHQFYLNKDNINEANKYYTFGDMIKRIQFTMRMFFISESYAALIPGDVGIANEIRNKLRNPDKIFDLNLIDNNIYMSYRIDWRKPKGGMLDHLIWKERLTKRECLFVGDINRDEQAAQDARIDFCYAEEFFK